MIWFSLYCIYHIIWYWMILEFVNDVYTCIHAYMVMIYTYSVTGFFILCIWYTISCDSVFFYSKNWMNRVATSSTEHRLLQSEPTGSIFSQGHVLIAWKISNIPGFRNGQSPGNMLRWSMSNLAVIIEFVFPTGDMEQYIWYTICKWPSSARNVSTTPGTRGLGWPNGSQLLQASFWNTPKLGTDVGNVNFSRLQESESQTNQGCLKNILALLLHLPFLIDCRW